jgi:hypothetical protein
MHRQDFVYRYISGSRSIIAEGSSLPGRDNTSVGEKFQAI